MFKNAIVLTGGISTGKSTVSNLFMLEGFLTIDADKITHQILDDNNATIEKLFGKRYILDGKVQRKKLGELIFNDIDEKIKLEKFIHPLIKKQIIQDARIFELNNKPYLIDIPLFFENRNYDIKRSIVVYTTKEQQINRLIKRDKITKQEALVRIDNQMSIENKKKLSTYIIDNTKTLKELINEVQMVKNLILQEDR